MIEVIENTWVVKVVDILAKWAKERMEKSQETTPEQKMALQLAPKYILYTSVMERGWGIGRGSGQDWEKGMTTSSLFKIAIVQPSLKIGIGTQLVRWVVGENNRNYLGFSGIMPLYFYFMPFCNINRKAIRFLYDGVYKYAYKSTVRPTYLYIGASRWVNTRMLDFGLCYYIFEFLNVKLGYIYSSYPLDSFEASNLYLSANLVIGSGWKARF